MLNWSTEAFKAKRCETDELVYIACRRSLHCNAFALQNNFSVKFIVIDDFLFSLTSLFKIISAHMRQANQ